MMEKKLSRLGIIEYCKHCAQVKNAGGTTVCGLTNQMGVFDQTCSNFKNKADQVDPAQKTAFFGSWKSALIVTILVLVRFVIRLGSNRSLDIFMVISLILCAVWWLAVLVNALKDD